MVRPNALVHSLVKSLVHPTIQQQILARNPPAWTLPLFWAVPSILLTKISAHLILLPEFAHFASQHKEAYHLTFFGVQVGLVIATILFLSMKYPDALWRPGTTQDRRTVISLCILLPLLVYHMSSWPRGFRAIAFCARYSHQPTVKIMIDQLHNKTWSALAYGSNPSGVIYSSAISFIGPVFEEILFSGLLVNAIARSFRATTAILITPVCFALSHGFQFGFGPQLIPLLCAGLTYTLIRIFSGSLRLAIFGHLLVNFVIFLPKWILAILHFMLQ